MKKYTNHTPGLRGINTDGGTVWIESGASVEIDPKTIIGALPDLGKASAKSVADDATAEIEKLKADHAEAIGTLKTDHAAALKEETARADKAEKDLKAATAEIEKLKKS
jgi:hypothetical protein